MLRAREQILTGLLRIGAALGTLALLVAILPPFYDTPPLVLVADSAIVVAIWVVALRRRLAYPLRVGVLLAGLVAISSVELAYFGLSQDAAILFLFCALLAALLLNLRAGAAVLLLGVGALAGVGTLIIAGDFLPLAHPVFELSASTLITTCLLVVMIAGSVQTGLALLLDHLRQAWQREHHARQMLEDERDQLELRVAERTRDLAQARDAALAASRAEAAQRSFLAALHQATLDLLHRHDLGDVLQMIVDRSALMLDAPYCALLLIEGGALAVRAYTDNQPFLRSDRVERAQARLSWQAIDTRQPAVLGDYGAWPDRRELYAGIQLAAVADFPILVGDRCVGVLSIGRSTPGQAFTPGEIQNGTQFAQLAALLVDNAQLYDTAVREIGERAKAERALELQALELQAHNAELELFARTVAHDLKSPLTGILGHSTLLLDLQGQLTPQEVRDSLSTITQMGHKQASIIDALLLLARVRAINAVPRQAVATPLLIADVAVRLQDAIASSRATISYPDTWPDALGYAPWVEEIWANYLSNALKYGGAPPTIALGADTPAPGVVRFWVRDNGPGLSPADQALLFQPFTRLHADRADGQGLGLTIVQRIAERLGGSVGVESELGRGATFFFTLPAGK